ncbi:conserved hypothetical protein [Pediculus humanus corporis]|uniref:Exonuclease domain-containing protein n=1 Tax=Pediculus humanus subsp. corporis TaxID=121224 RepID=E0W1R9_PEDHC|nr:uncharacterized protein Phum_PHUM581960 [Pediculus humanus corporis]EEB19651.1 conserved hypothetical protein [Pediculus humanus corporis]
MVNFKSIIVYDSETTGLPHLESNTTKITELAFMGCEIEHLKNINNLPRVLHKLVLLFNPMKMILPDSSEITGLENEDLMNIKPFCEEDVQVLIHFINRLPSPVCLIAHNGNKFDFPILQRQLFKLNLKLPDSVYCADSIKAFQEIYPNNSQLVKGGSKTYSKITHVQKTPLKQSQTPLIISDSNIQNANKLKVVRQLFPEDSDDEVQVVYSSLDNSTNEKTEVKTIKPNAPVRYTLSSVYQFLHGKNFEGAHRAEDDATALLSCIIRCEPFVNWINDKAVSFNSIKPLS